MAISQGKYSFNTGRDIQLKFISPTGEVDIDNVTGFDSKPEYADIKIDRLDGKQLHAAPEKGWTGSFDLYRANADLDRFFGAAADAWYDGGVYELSTMFAYVSEADGSQTVFKFTDCVMKLDDSGNWSGDKEVKMKVSFMASRREVK